MNYWLPYGNRGLLKNIRNIFNALAAGNAMAGKFVVLNEDELAALVERAVKKGVSAALAASRDLPSEMNEMQAAEYLGVSSATLRSWRCLKKGPKYRKIGKLIRYSQKDLGTWLDGNNVLTIDSPEACHETCRQ